MAVITENHIDGLFNTDALQSARKNGFIKEFTSSNIDDDDFEFIDDIERKLMDDDYKENGKNNSATVLLYDDIQVVEQVDPDNENYSMLSHLDEKLNKPYRMIKYLDLMKIYK